MCRQVENRGGSPPHNAQINGYTVPFFDRSINTAVTKSHEFVDAWIQRVIEYEAEGQSLVVGLGVELEPPDGDVSVGTIQLCIDHHCLIYHMFGDHSFPNSLQQFLLNPNNIFVGFDLGYRQLEILRRDAGLDRYVRYQDLNIFVAQYVHANDLRELATSVLDNLHLLRLQLGRGWDVEELSSEQIKYASVGAYMSYQIGKFLVTARNQPQVEGVIEQVHDYEVQIFNRSIHTTVTNSLIAVEDWIIDVTNIRHLYHYVGFDAELVTVDNHPHIVTVQFCVENRCLIIQFHQMDGRYLPNLEHFLLHANNIFVGFDILGKMRMLEDSLLCDQRGRLSVMDLGRFWAIRLGMPELNNSGPITLSGILFGEEVQRPEVESDWDRPLLSDAQVQYACINAATSYEIGSRMLPPRA